MAKQVKYRPSLTAIQVSYIVATFKASQPMTEEAYSIIATLDPFLTKIGNSSIAPSHIAQNKPVANSLDALGAYTDVSKLPIPIDSNETINPADYSDKVSYWEACYTKYTASPASCSLIEITNAQEYKYLEGLMTEEEVVAFERAQFVAFNQ